MTRTHDIDGPAGPGFPGGGGTELEQRLSAVLRDRAALAPQAPSVQAAADALGVVRRRRRQRVQVGAVLGVAGLLALAAPRLDDVLGGLRPPALATPGPATTVSSPAPSLTASLDAPMPVWVLAQDATSPSTLTESAVVWDQDDVDAFFAAGYTYTDAVALAELWQHPGDATYAKVTGGSELRTGASLPVTPGSTPSLVGDDPAWQVFTAAGHDVDDALALAQLWQMPSGYGAALKAGRELTEGVQLPVPTPAADGGAQDGRARQAWVDAGYDDQDAQELAGLWALGDPDQAVLAGGYNLLGGQPVPIKR